MVHVHDVFAQTVPDGPVLEAALRQMGVRSEFIRTDHRAGADISENDRLQSLAPDVWHNTGTQIAIPLNHAKDSCFAVGSAATLAVALPPDQRFIHFDMSAQRTVAIGLCHQLAQLMADAPSRFVGHAKLALQFLRGYAMSRRGEQVHGVKPLLERRARFLERCPHAWVNVMPAKLAHVGPALRDAMEFRLPIAGRAGGRLAVLHGHDPVQTGLVGRVFGKKLLVRVFHCLSPYLLYRHCA